MDTAGLRSAHPSPPLVFTQQRGIDYLNLTLAVSDHSLLNMEFIMSSEDEEIIDFLKKYGSMRHVPLLTLTQFYKNLIEYQDGAAIESLALLLPYTHELKDNLDVKYYVQALASVRFSHSGAEPCPLADVKQSLSVVESDLNPPEIQKVIVEHIVRKDELNTHSDFPIKRHSFSGKIPRPNRNHGRCLKSLLSAAADIVKRLSPEATPETYLQLLDAALGTVEDGEELFRLDPGEKASTYLCPPSSCPEPLLLREEELLLKKQIDTFSNSVVTGVGTPACLTSTSKKRKVTHQHFQSSLL
ncbi:hypothetical protein N1851_034549 [Merluccius polli]|uniref:Uncharacterized protein n=1 Tax=Merluccius polli TaxID=89951 RepID=A0AA47LZG6_MERPO|nr:hypothetical protein N1851_034549 [Merluccius polli]